MVSTASISSAHTLDDYEEGTFDISGNITLATSGSVTLQSSCAFLVTLRSCRMVTIIGGNPRISSVSSPVGNIRFTLPFAVAGTTSQSRGGSGHMYYDASAVGYAIKIIYVLRKYKLLCP